MKSILTFSLLFGVFVVPIQAILAETQDTYSNSQNVALLQASVTPFSILEDEDNISDDKALSPNVGLTGVSDDQDILDSSCGEPNVYVVVAGDSISKVAKLLDVSENTVIAANNMKKILTRDDVLFIPSVSGVQHIVAKGQTLQQISKLYKVDMNDIVFCNGITSDAMLEIGDELTVPGGEIDVKENNETPKKSTTPKKKQYYENYSVQNIAGFINPVPKYKRVSQKIHGNNSVDLAAPIGTPIVASASGTVLLARKGYNGGYGNMIIIKHPNGTRTLYAHLSKISISKGEQVSQGEVIGYVGSTGRSTGPHLHYEVHGARNNALDL